MIRVIEGPGHDRIGAICSAISGPGAVWVFPTARQAYAATHTRPSQCFGEPFLSTFPSFRSWLFALTRAAGQAAPFGMDTETTLRCAADFGVPVATLDKAQLSSIHDPGGWDKTHPDTDLGRWSAFCAQHNLAPANTLERVYRPLVEANDRKYEFPVVIVAGEDLDHESAALIRIMSEHGRDFVIYLAAELCTLKFRGADPAYVRSMASDLTLDCARYVPWRNPPPPSVAVWTHPTMAPAGFGEKFDTPIFKATRALAEFDAVQAASMVVCGCQAEPWITHELQRVWCWAEHTPQDRVDGLWKDVAPASYDLARANWPHLLSLTVEQFCGHMGGGLPNQDLLPWHLPARWSTNVWAAKGIDVGRDVEVAGFGNHALPGAVALSMMGRARV
jgi:hypothetical protein